MEGPGWLVGLLNWQVQIVVTINVLAFLAVSTEALTPAVLRPPCLGTPVNCRPFRKGAVKFGISCELSAARGYSHWLCVKESDQAGYFPAVLEKECDLSYWARSFSSQASTEDRAVFTASHLSPVGSGDPSTLVAVWSWSGPEPGVAPAPRDMRLCNSERLFFLTIQFGFESFYSFKLVNKKKFSLWTYPADSWRRLVPPALRWMLQPNAEVDEGTVKRKWNLEYVVWDSNPCFATPVVRPQASYLIFFVSS